jgi:hypothetical protein
MFVQLAGLHNGTAPVAAQIVRRGAVPLVALVGLVELVHQVAKRRGRKGERGRQRVSSADRDQIEHVGTVAEIAATVAQRNVPRGLVSDVPDRSEREVARLCAKVGGNP